MASPEHKKRSSKSLKRSLQVDSIESSSSTATTTANASTVEVVITSPRETQNTTKEIPHQNPMDVDQTVAGSTEPLNLLMSGLPRGSLPADLITYKETVPSTGKGSNGSHREIVWIWAKQSCSRCTEDNERCWTYEEGRVCRRCRVLHRHCNFSYGQTVPLLMNYTILQSITEFL